jgi:hypothetical protein
MFESENLPRWAGWLGWMACGDFCILLLSASCMAGCTALSSERERKKPPPPHSAMFVMQIDPFSFFSSLSLKESQSVSQSSCIVKTSSTHSRFATPCFPLLPSARPSVRLGLKCTFPSFQDAVAVTAAALCLTVSLGLSKATHAARPKNDEAQKVSCGRAIK